MRDYKELVSVFRCEADGFLMADAPDVLMADSLNSAADAIDELQSQINGWIERERKSLLKSVPRWIPVTERLPERGYYVLAYEDGDILMASYEGGNWVLRDMYEVIDDIKPTHWMPLPEPPKEDADA